MNILVIVMIVLSYIFCGIMVGGIIRAIDDDKKMTVEDKAVICFLWPIIIVLAIVWLISKGFSWSIDETGSFFLSVKKMLRRK